MEPLKVKIENILYATDLSKSAQHAFSYAVSLASQYRAKLTLLNVIPEEPAIVESSKRQAPRIAPRRTASRISRFIT